MSAPDGATWRSGYATVCKTVYTSSILVVASIHIINGLSRLYERPDEVQADVRLKPLLDSGAQHAAYQPSGNGTSGQGARLSLAGRGF